MVTVESQPTKSDQGKQSVPETATTEGTKIDESRELYSFIDKGGNGADRM